jgi:hypothetical protein
MVFVEGDDYRQLRRPGDDPARFRSVVRPTQVPPAPNSVIYQYRGENFTTSTWTDTSPSGTTAGLDVIGPSAGTIGGEPGGVSDGVDDVAVSTATPGDGPESLPQKSSYGVALTFKKSNPFDDKNWFGANSSGNSHFRAGDIDAADASNGEFLFTQRDDNGNEVAVETVKQFDTNSPEVIIVNVGGPSVSDIDIYSGSDMTTPIATNTVLDKPFDPANYSNDTAMALFARNNNGTIDRHQELTIGFAEFNASPYSLQERKNVLARRGEV